MITMAAPDVVGANAQPVAIALLVVAIAGYGPSNSVIGPKRSHGSAAITCRSQLVGAVVVTPFGLNGLATSDPTTESIVP